MKLLLSSLLLASHCALSSWSVSSGTNVVTQSPSDISVTEGETVTITCCWTMKLERIRVLWLKNQTDMNQTNISDELFFNVKNHSQGSLQKDTPDCSNLTLTNVTRKDSGIYICRVTVEVPFFTKVEGNGTVLKVLARDATKDNNLQTLHNTLLLPVITPLAVVALLLLISLVCVCIRRRRKAQAARVIYEVPHFDSEEAEMDKHSTSSSRGSSQWCQVPVYESVDYFERVENRGQPPVQKTEANVEVP